MNAKIISILFLLLSLNNLFGQDIVDCEYYSKHSIKGIKIEESKHNYKIEIKDIQHDTTFIWGNIEYIYANHYHFAEYHNKNLYVIKRFDTSQPSWQDELWLLNSKNSKLIAKSKGIDFRVNKNETFVAYTKGNEPILFIKNLKNDSVTEVEAIPDTLHGCNITLMNWAINSCVFWGRISRAAGTYYFFKYDINNNNLRFYEKPKNCRSEFSLNPDFGILIYTDYPFIFDSDYYNSFSESETKVRLFRKTLGMKNEQIIETNTAKGYAPRWICPAYYEINSSESKSRIRLKN